MELLLGVEAIRIFGFVFLLLTQSGVLPESFGYQAAWGDMLVGWLSVAAIIIWITRRKYRRRFVFVATLFGMVDVANALHHALATPLADGSRWRRPPIGHSVRVYVPLCRNTQ